VEKSCRGSGVGKFESDGEGGKKRRLGLAVSHGDREPGEAGLVADSATLALREAQPDVRIEVLGLIEARVEPSTEVFTDQKAAATEPLGGSVDLSPPDIRSCGRSLIS
jgi:hypothetical protein